MMGIENYKTLSEEQGRVLLKLARHTIALELGMKIGPAEAVEIEKRISDPAFSVQRGTFVTLQMHGGLRGCIGCLTPSESIISGIKRNAINAAFHDSRFAPLTSEEFAKVQIEISILTEPQELEFDDSDDLLDQLRPNIDGVIIKKGIMRATFLPQVWEQLPRPQDFLGHLCMKAGLPSNIWKTSRLEVLTYQVQKFVEDKPG